MVTGISLIQQGINQLKSELENTLYAAAEEVRNLGRVYSEDYADAILDKNGYGGNVAEIYFFNFDLEAAEADIHSLDDVKCYRLWVEEMQKVQRIVSKYDGRIEANYLPLQGYLSEVQEDSEIPKHRVHVGFFLPDLGRLRLMRDAEAAIERHKSTPIQEA